MEYATRDEAQNAVNTLSNQSLMGRLVYVREVCIEVFDKLGWHELTISRTVKLNPVSSVDLLVEISAPVPEAVSVVVSAVTPAATPAAPVVRFMSQTFVPPLTPRDAKSRQVLLTPQFSFPSMLAGKT